jgi:hypothetical protein
MGYLQTSDGTDDSIKYGRIISIVVIIAVLITAFFFLNKSVEDDNCDPKRTYLEVFFKYSGWVLWTLAFLYSIYIFFIKKVEIGGKRASRFSHGTRGLPVYKRQRRARVVPTTPQPQPQTQ